MKKKMKMKRKQRGIFLPIVAVMMLLVMLSVLMVASFGSESRKLLRRAEMAEVCRGAATSALRELRSAIEKDIEGTSDTWPEWWKGMLPPYDGLPADELPDVITPATTAAYAPLGVTIDSISVKCLDRRTGHQVKAQGLLEFLVTASWQGKGYDDVSVTRAERLRFYVQYRTIGSVPDPSNPAVSYPDVEPSLMLFPLCTEERVGGGA
jgi:hypothetical protein